MSAATDFLAAVLPHGVWTTLCAINPATGAIEGLAVNSTTLDEADAWLAEHAAFNLYWTVNTVTPRVNKKPDKKQIVAMRWVHVDVDDPNKEALDRLRNYHLPPTLIIASGGGFQGFWLLKTAVLLNGNLAKLEAANQRVMTDLGGDHCFNIDRIMRLPGTTNWPTAKKRERGRVPVGAFLMEESWHRVYTLDQFGSAAVAPTPVAQETKPRDESESGRLYRAVYKVVAADPDVIDADLLTQFREHAHVAKMSDADRERAILRCATKARTHTDKVKGVVLAEMNSRHAIINWRGRTLVMTEFIDPVFQHPVFELSAKSDLKDWYIDHSWVGGKDRGTWWFEHKQRRKYTGIVFSPKGDVDGYYNLWRGFAVKPNASAKCPLFKQFILEVVCSGNPEHYRYVMAWCADTVQNPAERPGIALVLRGVQGCGKGTLFRTLGDLFGNHFLHVRHARHVVGNFNAHLVNVLLLFADEAFWAGDKQGEGALKALTTEPTLPIEFKGRDVMRVQNHIRLAVASNHDWVVPAAMDDRRFAIFDVSDRHAKDTAYFKRVYAELDNGGREAWLHELMTFDLSACDLRTIPATEARTQQQIYSASPLEAWWYGRLCAGAPLSTLDEWKQEVPSEDMRADFAKEAGVAGMRHRGMRTEFGMAMTKLVKEIVKRKVTVTVGGEPMRVYHYALPSLAECRQQFAKAMGREDLPWPNDETTGGADRSVKHDEAF